MIEYAVGILLIVGGCFGAIGSLGLVRMPDVLVRMHSSTKIGTLSPWLILAASALWFWDAAVTARVVLIVLFLMMTAPIASHMIGRAAIALGVPLFRAPGQEPYSADDAAVPPEQSPR